jgi:predicted XRE-type DNA-binding protein
MKNKKNKNENHLNKEWITPELRDYISYELVSGSTQISKDAPLVDQIKYRLCAQIVRFHLSNEVPQRELASKLDIDHPEMSRILHYKIERYTIDRLIRYVEILYPHLSIEVHAA